ncbi:MAG: cytochrome b/b6 domain-containing protein [Hyphomonadaceae bacterium]
MSANPTRYSAVAVVLHWAIALAILINWPLGWWMHEAAEDGGTSAAIFEAFQLHKSIGLAVLALSLVRLGWRLTHAPPALPAQMPGWERFVSKAVHWIFYALMIALPLSGWVYVSAGWSAELERPFQVPTLFFGLFEAPHLFGLDRAALEVRQAVAEAAIEAHEVFAYAMLGLAALHIAAALKHHVIDGDAVLAHMVPGLRGRNETAGPVASAARRATLGAGFALIAIAAAAALYAIATLGQGGQQTAEAAPQAPSAESAPSAVAAPETPPVETAAPAGAPASGEPPLWRVDQSASAIRFSGEHAGQRFEGVFSRWRAEIRFDPGNLDASSALVTIETASAADGIPIHDSSLPQPEWFDSANHPHAVFRTTRIRARGDGAYEARGVLTLKGERIDIDLPFTLRIEGGRAIMGGSAEIDRREANLGMASDPDAEWVSRDIAVSVHVEAQR